MVYGNKSRPVILWKMFEMKKWIWPGMLIGFVVVLLKLFLKFSTCPINRGYIVLHQPLVLLLSLKVANVRICHITESSSWCWNMSHHNYHYISLCCLFPGVSLLSLSLWSSAATKFEHVPIKHVIISEALAVEQIPEQLAKVTEKNKNH